MAVVTGDEFRTPISIDDQASGALNKINQSANKTAGGFGKLGASAITLNQTLELVRKGFVAGQRIIAGTVGEFASFETALVGVAKTANLTAEQTDAMGDAFQRLSEQIPTSANELAGIAQTAGQLGVTGSERILKFTETMAKMAGASDLAGDAGATALARILNVTEGGVDNIDRFASAIVGLGNQFAATESEIAAVATEVARSTSVFEPGAANVAGLSTALKSMGIQAQLGGSVVGKSFRVIDDAIRGGGANFEKLQQITGKTGDELRKTFATDSTKVFQQFVEGLGRIQQSGGSVSAALETLDLKGDEVNKVLPVMAQRSDLVGRALNVANTEFERNAALNEEAARANQTLAAEWQKLQNVLTNAAADLGGEMAPAIKEIVVLLKSTLVDAITRTKQVWSSFTTAIENVDFKGIAEQFEFFGLAVAAALAPLAAPAIAGALATFTAWAAPLAVIAIKFAVIGGAIVAAAAAVDILIRNMERLDDLGTVIGSAFESLWERIGRGFNALSIGILSGLESIIEPVAGTFLDVGDVAQSALQGIRETMAGLGDDMDANNAKIAAAEQKFMDVGKTLDLGFAGKVFAEGEKFLNSFNAELEKTVGMTNQAADNVDKMTKPEKTPRPIDTTPGGGAEISFTPLFDQSQIATITSAMGTATGGLASAAASMTAGPLMFAEAANMILDAILRLINIVPEMLDKIADVFNSLTELPMKLVQSVTGVFDAITGFVENFIPNLIQMVGDLVMAAVEFLADGLPDAIMSLAESIP
jgi:TP901 family phage tail tape measure protein